jgi:hypothetical protein
MMIYGPYLFMPLSGKCAVAYVAFRGAIDWLLQHVDARALTMRPKHSFHFRSRDILLSSKP